MLKWRNVLLTSRRIYSLPKPNHKFTRIFYSTLPEDEEIPITFENVRTFEEIPTPFTRPPKVDKWDPSKLPEIKQPPPPEVHSIISGSTTCIGCGAAFQTTNEKEEGYIPPKALQSFIEDSIKENEIVQKVVTKMQRIQKLMEQYGVDERGIPKNITPDDAITRRELKIFKRYEKGKTLVCMRCHKLSHYGKNISQDISPENFYEKLQKIKEKDVLIVLIVDLYDVQSSFIPRFNECIGDNKVLVVANKIDLIPSGRDWTQIETWLRRIIKAEGIKNVAGVHLVSSLKGTSMKTLGAKIEKLREERDVYVIGSTNVGKSTLVNKLLTIFGKSNHRSKPKLTMSNLPGTTLKTVSFPIRGGADKKNAFLFDTPGITNPYLVSNYLSAEEWKYAYPRKKINPKHFRLTPGRCLFLGGIARIDYVENAIPREDLNRIIFTCFISSHLPTHLTKIEKADEFYEKHLGNLIYPPTKDNKHLYPMNDETIFEFDSYSRKESAFDIVISGMGWVTVTGVGDNIKIRVKHPKKIKIYKREPMLPKITYKLPKAKIRE